MLKQAVESKEINYVLHFTRLENLNSILTNGLIPRSTLETNGHSFTYNDELRIDGYKNATCCSIGFPNYKMFYGVRQANPNTEWVVLGIDKKILWEKNVAFCVSNAASTEILQTPLANLQGVNAFSKLFDDYHDIQRTNLNIPDNLPTNPQAEVLVFDTIEPENIFGIVFQTTDQKAQYEQNYPDLETIVNNSFFSARRDYEHWRSNNGN